MQYHLFQSPKDNFQTTTTKTKTPFAMTQSPLNQLTTGSNILDNWTLLFIDRHDVSYSHFQVISLSGCILCELLTGYPLLPGEDEGKIQIFFLIPSGSD